MSATSSPLTRLVLFIAGLALAGIIVAGTHSFAIDLPHQKTMQAPANSVGEDSCLEMCQDLHDNCMDSADVCEADYSRCRTHCTLSEEPYRPIFVP